MNLTYSYLPTRWICSPIFSSRINLLSCMMLKIVNAALKTKAKVKAWTFEAKVIGLEAKAKAIKCGLEAKAWPQLEDYITEKIRKTRTKRRCYGATLTEYDKQQCVCATCSRLTIAWYILLLRSPSATPCSSKSEWHFCNVSSRFGLHHACLELVTNTYPLSDT